MQDMDVMIKAKKETKDTVNMNHQERKAEWMTEGPFILFILPLMISGIFQQLYAPINAALISHYRSAESVAVIGACGFIGTLQNLFFGGMALGFGIFLCECAGSEEGGSLREGTTAAMLSCLALTVFGILLSAFARPILNLLQVKDTLIREAVPYASVVFAGSGTMVLKNTLVWLLQAKKETGRAGRLNPAPRPFSPRAFSPRRIEFLWSSSLSAIISSRRIALPRGRSLSAIID